MEKDAVWAKRCNLGKKMQFGQKFTVWVILPVTHTGEILYIERLVTTSNMSKTVDKDVCNCSLIVIPPNIANVSPICTPKICGEQKDAVRAK